MKNTRIELLRGFVALLTALAVPLCASGATFTNGSFEQPGITTGTEQALSDGSTVITGWTANAGVLGTYRAANDFSASGNPNGTWEYGYRTSLGGGFTIFDTATTRSTTADFWTDSTLGDDPNVVHNGTGAAISPFTEFTLQPDQLAQSPGPNGELSVIRWNPPHIGTFTVHVEWVGLNAATSTDVHVLLNGASIYDGTVTGTGTASWDNASNPNTLVPGIYFEFAVGNGGDSSAANVDMTGVTITITEASGDPGMVYVKDDVSHPAAAVNGSHLVSFGRNGGRAGTLSQTFDTVPGRFYVVNHRLTTEGTNGDGQTMMVEAFDGAVSLGSTGNNIPATQGQWSFGTPFRFIATSTSTRLVFSDTTPLGSGANASWALDDLSVSFIEPGSILYTRNPSGTREMVVMNADGSGKTVLTLNTASVLKCALTSDGKAVAFSDFSGALYVMKAELMTSGGTNDPVNVLNGASITGSFSSGMAWSPNGRFIAFQGSNSHVYVIKARDSGGTITPFNASTNPVIDVFASNSGAANPAWSPDGRHLAIAEGGTIKAFPVTDGAGTITPATFASTVSLTDPNNFVTSKTSVAWSGDGRKIAFVETSFSGGTTSRVVLLNARDATGTLTPESGANVRVPLYAFTAAPLAETVSWSPDGSLLAVSGTSGGQSNIDTILPAVVDGTNPRVPVTTTATGGGGAAVFAAGLTLPVPDFTLDSDIDTLEPYSAANPWTFKARLVQPLSPSTTVRVQSSTTPAVEGSWTDIPGAGMDNNGPDPGIGTAQTWVATTSQVPNPVDIYFRVVAEATGRTRAVSVVRGPFPPNAGLKIPDFTPDSHIVTTTPFQTGKRWNFKVLYGASDEVTPAGFNMIVQTSSGAAGPWTELTGADFIRSSPTSRTWLAESFAVPANANLHFRVVASAPGLNAGVSAIRGPFDVGAAAAVLEAIVTASTPADPANGAICALVDTITYTIRCRNTGGLAAQNVILTEFLPEELQIRLARTDAPGAKVTLGGRKALWNLGSLPAESGETVFTVRAAIDSDKRLVGTQISNSLVRLFEGPVPNGNFAAPVRTLVVPAVDVVSSTVETQVFPGGIVEFRLTVKNRAGYISKNVRLEAPVPARSILQLGGSKPVYCNAAFDEAPLLDANQKVVPLPTWDADRRTVFFNIGSIAPLETVRMRYRVRMQYDAPVSVGATFSIAGYAGTFKPVRGGSLAMDVSSTAASVPVTGAAAATNRPSVVMGTTMRSAGGTTALAPDQFNKQRAQNIALVADGAAATVPDSGPAPGFPNRATLRTNQIRYTTTFENIGYATAEYIRILIGIPPHTKLVGNAVSTNGAKAARVKVLNAADSREVSEDEGDDAYRYAYVDFPYIDPNRFDPVLPFVFPKPADSIRTLEFTLQLTAKAQTGEQIRTFIIGRSDELVQDFTADLTSFLANVVAPVSIEREHEESYPTEIRQDNTAVRNTFIFRNTGGIAARDVVIDVKVPAGATVLNTALNRCGYANTRGNSVIGSAANLSANGYVRFRVGTMGPGATVEPSVSYFNPPLATLNRNADTSGAFSFTCSTIAYHRSDPAPLTPLRAGRFTAAARNPQDAFVRAADPTDTKTFITQNAPLDAVAGGTITYLVTWANTSNNTYYTGAAQFRIPEHTTFESATVYSDGFGLGEEPVIVPPSAEHPRGLVQWGTSAIPAPHRAHCASVTVRVDNDAAGKLVLSEFVRVAGDGTPPRYSPDHICIVRKENESDESLRERVFAFTLLDSMKDSLGNAQMQEEKHRKIREDFDAFYVPGARVNAIGGVDYFHLKSGELIIPLGAGEVLVTGIVAGGGGNIVAAGGGNLLGQDGASIVAAGGGNLISINGLGALTKSTLKDIYATIVAAGGGNIVAAGGG